MQEYLDINDVAQLLSVSTATVRRMWASGQITKPIRVGRRSIRWHREQLQAFLMNRPGVVQPAPQKVTTK